MVPQLAVPGEQGHLGVALMRGAELARGQATDALQKLNVMCERFAAGQTRENAVYEELSRGAHLASSELRTYGEICESLAILPQQACRRLIQAGHEIQSRALEQETLFRASALSPSAVFYDDLISARALALPHASPVFSKRLAQTTTQSSKEFQHDAPH